MICKKQTKKPGAGDAARAWRNGTLSQAQQLISDRRPSLFEDPYAETASQESPAKRTERIILPRIRSQRGVQAINDDTRMILENEIAVYRDRGREFIENERVKYDTKRTNFIKERDAERIRRG